MKHPKLTVTIPEPCHDFVHQENDFGHFHSSQLNRKKQQYWFICIVLLLLPFGLFSQETSADKKKVITTIQVDSLKTISITGFVRDETQMPLPGGTVAIKGTTVQSTTDYSGKFSIKATPGDTLVVNYVGYIVQEIEVVENTTEYDIKLIASDELVNVTKVGGYWYYDTGFPSTHIETEEMKALKERTRNYFNFQRKKRKEKHAKRKAERAKRKAARKANPNNSSTKD